MLPTLSRFSVSLGPDSRLRHWCSSRSLRISPLHREFRYPLPHSSHTVSKAIPTLKAGLSLQTCIATYAPFTPSHSGQRSPPTYYRGCWHVVSRGFRQVPSSHEILPHAYSSLLIRLYNPKAFITHAASLRQGCPHCARFLTAASRRSLGRISVPMWPFTLSGRLLIVALVGRYPTNKLISRELISRR